MIRPGDEPIPGYRLEERLGAGQYGEVWRAITPGRTQLALKFLDMTGRHGWKEFRAVQRVKQIRHAHLMPIVALWLLDADGEVLTDDAVDSLSDDGSTSDSRLAETIDPSDEPAKPPARMIIATLLADGSLRDRLEECLNAGLSGVPADELQVYLHEAAKGIDFLNSVRHESSDGVVGVQHCDIKPDNLLLTGGSVTVGDFGVAQVLSDAVNEYKATSLSGSPAYMAPEAFEQQPSASSDQYSLAVTYYELRTGGLPVAPGGFAEVYNAHRLGELDFSQVPDGEQQVLRRATATDPGRRFPTAVAFAEALRAAGDKPAKPARSYWPFAAAAIAVAAVAGVALLAMMPGGPARLDVELRFDLPNAAVLVNGEQQTVGPDGVLVIEHFEGQPLQVEVLGNAERKDHEWLISASDLQSQTKFDLAIPFTAAHHAADALDLLARGRPRDAAAAYERAVADSADEYARLTPPKVWRSAGVLWGDCVGVSPQGDWLVEGGRDGVVRRWRIDARGVGEAPEEMGRLPGRIVSVAVGAGFVAAATDEGLVWVSDGTNSRSLVEWDDAEVALVVTRQQDWLVAAAAGDLKTTVFAWPALSLPTASSGRSVGEQRGEFPRMVPLAKDSVVLATMDDEALVWEWELNPPRSSQQGRQSGEVLSLESAERAPVFAYAGVASGGRGGGAAMVDRSAGARWGLASDQSDSIIACAVDPDGDKAATAERLGEFEAAGSVVFWRPPPGAEEAVPDRVLDFDRELGDVTALVVSGKRWLAAGHERGAVSLWRLKAGASRPLMSIGGGDRVAALRLSSDGRWLFAASRDGRMAAFDLARLEMIASACERAGVEPVGVSDQTPDST